MSKLIFCPLYSGSSGNSILISSGTTSILIDAGLAGKHIDSALNSIGFNTKDIDAILVTHEHIDHTKGVGILSRKYDIPIYASQGTWKGMYKTLGKLDENNIRLLNSTPFSIKDLDIVNFSTPHDALDSKGFSIFNKNKKICVATDIGHFSREVKNNLLDSDVILLESNHDVEMLKFGPYPYNLKRRVLSDVGHLSNEACGKAILEILDHKQKKIILGHLSNTNNIPELAYQTVFNILSANKVKIGTDISLGIAERNKPSNYIEL